MNLPVPTSSPTYEDCASLQVFADSTGLPPLKRRKSAPKALQNPARPPRPMNAWLLFRSDQVRLLRTKNPAMHTPQGELSKIVADIWRNCDETTRLHYEHLAEKEKVEHRKRYPDFKFKYKSGKTRSRDQLPSFHASSFTPERIASFGLPERISCSSATSTSGSTGPTGEYESEQRPRHDSEPLPSQYQHQHLIRPETPCYDEEPFPRNYDQRPHPQKATSSYTGHDGPNHPPTSSGLPVPAPSEFPAYQFTHDYQHLLHDYQHLQYFYRQPANDEFPSQWAEAAFAANSMSPVLGTFPQHMSSEISLAASSGYMPEYSPSEHYYCPEQSLEQKHPTHS